MKKILVINTGSTSTKIAVFNDSEKVYAKTIQHSDEEISAFDWVMDQKDFRTEKIYEDITSAGFKLSEFDCIMSRGGMLPACKSGAYIIDSAMVDYFYGQKFNAHISNVSCAVALELVKRSGRDIPSYIYDPVTVDELAPIARITGIPEITKVSRGHALNTHAMAYKCAEEIMHKPISECTFIVQHLGGGCSVWLIDKGYSIDMYSDDDAGFCPERCGKIQALSLIKMCYSGKYTLSDMDKKVRGNSGLKAHLGTSDIRKVEEMIAGGDKHAKLIFEAFAYGVAKGIGDLATVVKGKVDRIILTGGAAHSKMLTDWIKERVEWIAPVEVMAGEYEMEALAAGGLRILGGSEKANIFNF